MKIKTGLIVVLSYILFAGYTFINSTDEDHTDYPQLDEGSHPYLHKYDVKFYWIDLEITDTSTYVEGNTLIYVKVLDDNIDTLFFELKSELEVDSVWINSQPNAFSHFDEYVKIPLSDIYITGDYIEARVFYKGFGGSEGFFSGMSTGNDWQYQTSVTWTLSEPFKARQWFPCKQVLGDKADSAYIYITVDERLKAGSNGVLTNITDLTGNKKRYEWKTFYPVAYYLLSLTVAEYDEYIIYAKPDGYDDSIVIQNYIYKNDFLHNHKADIDATADLIELFSGLYGLYPFAEEKYGHCLAPMGGGMEHQTMTTLSGVGFILVAHELSHQWFGDNVTCATWSDIWINEGFASYSEYLALQNLKTQEEADEWMEEAQHAATVNSTGSIYVPEEEADDELRIFNYYLSYKKGAAMLHMIRYETGNDSLFFTILQTFQTRYADSVATGEDFKNLVEEKTGKNFTDFFDQWYYGEGYPSFSIQWKQNNDSITIISEQTTTSTTTPLYKMNIEYQLSLPSADTTIILCQDSNEEEYKIYMPEVVSKITFDPDNWLIKKVEITNLNRIELDDAKIYVFPNPFNDKISIRFIDLEYERIEISLTNLSGQKVIHTSTFKDSVSINTSHVPPGFYLLEISDGEMQYVKKMMKD